LTYLKDSLKADEKSVDLQVLLIGTNISKYYSQYALDYNYFVVDYLKKGHDRYPGIKEKGAWRYELFKNYPREKETVTDIASMLRGNFIYEEELPFFDWKITGEKQTILSYKCQKATVSFRGRDYVAWFATDIPIPNGPWKFGGLPGLILNLHDIKNNFIFECNGLEQLKQKEPIQFYQVDYTKITRKDLAKTYQRFHNDMVEYMKILGTKVHVKNGSNTLKLSYNPIELE
jgi:GLPGLI family protein